MHGSSYSCHRFDAPSGVDRSLTQACCLPDPAAFADAPGKVHSEHEVRADNGRLSQWSRGWWPGDNTVGAEPRLKADPHARFDNAEVIRRMCRLLAVEEGTDIVPLLFAIRSSLL